MNNTTNVTELLSVVYDYEPADPKSKASLLMDGVEQALSRANYKWVDQVLSEIEFSKAGPVAAIALIKSTARVLHLLQHHHQATMLAINYLCSLGYDGRKMLGKFHDHQVN